MVNREQCKGACCCCVASDSRKSSGVIYANPPVKGECRGSVAVPIGGVGIVTWSEVCKYPVAVASGRMSCRDGQGLGCTSDSDVLLVMWIFISLHVLY
jgi:hypothetical protein